MHQNAVLSKNTEVKYLKYHTKIVQAARDKWLGHHHLAISLNRFLPDADFLSFPIVREVGQIPRCSYSNIYLLPGSVKQTVLGFNIFEQRACGFDLMGIFCIFATNKEEFYLDKKENIVLYLLSWKTQDRVIFQELKWD